MYRSYDCNTVLKWRRWFDASPALFKLLEEVQSAGSFFGYD